MWDLAKQGWHHVYDLTREGLGRARAIGQRIVETDPSSPKGHQLIAVANGHMILMGFASDVQAMKDEALEAAQEAVRRDRRDEYSLWMLGIVLGSLFGRTEPGIAAYRQALDVNLNFSLAYSSLGTTLSFAGLADEAIENTMIAIHLNPRDPSIFRYTSLALAYFLRSEFERSSEWSARAVARKPDWWLGHLLEAASCSMLGGADRAREAVHYLQACIPNVTLSTLPLQPVRSGPAKQTFYDALRLAGLPD